MSERIARGPRPGVDGDNNPLAGEDGGLPRLNAHARDLLLGGHEDVPVGLLHRVGQQDPAVLAPFPLHCNKIASCKLYKNK